MGGRSPILEFQIGIVNDAFLWTRRAGSTFRLLGSSALSSTWSIRVRILVPEPGAIP